MITITIYALTLGCLAISSTLIFKKLHGFNIIDKVLFSISPFLIFLVINSILVNIVDCSSVDWCHNRLAVAFALSHGYKHINAFESGPVLTWMYGPMAAIAYWPATLTKLPMFAISFGTFLSFIFFFLPILRFSFPMTCNDSNNDSKSISLRNVMLCIFAFLVSSFLVPAIFETTLARSAFGIHADAPSLGLAGASCAFLYFRKPKNIDASLAFSAISAILAVWVKQNLFPLPIALLTYVLFAEGISLFKRYLFYFFLAGIVISTFFIFIFDGKYLYFVMVEWPASWPWKDSDLIPGTYQGLTDPGRIKLLKDSLYELLKYSIIFFSAISLYLFHHLRHFRYHKLSDFLRSNPWSILLIVSLYMFPIAILSRVKLGGGTNSLSVALYFLLCAFTAILSSTLLSMFNNESDLRRFKSVSFSILLMITVLIFRVFRYEYNPAKFPYFLSHYANNPVQEAYTYSRVFPGKIYFPDIPLVSIITEGKAYHSSLGLMDRMFYSSVSYDSSLNLIDGKLLEKYRVSGSHFRSYIPSDVQYVAFPGESPKNSMFLSYLPAFRKRVQLDELPGWIIFSKK